METDSQRSGSAAPAKRLRVLVVDDAPLVRELLVRELAQYPWLLVAGTAANGREAVELVASLRPDLVIMDLNMPVMDGVKATRVIKHQPGAPRIVVVSFEEGPIVRAVMEAGADGFCAKARLSDDLRSQLLTLYPEFGAP